MICHKSDITCEKVAEILKNGGVVIIPTDTVYGFSGITTKSFETDRKIREIKGRSESKPLICLIASPTDISKYTDDVISENLLEKWPGALTVIVKNKNDESTTAYRCPGDPWLRKVIELSGNTIFSTSVNLSGQPVLETEAEIEEVFKDKVDLIVLDGDRKNARPSTLVKMEGGKVIVLRQGDVTV
ncbi:MAG: threonylcarbamoyl-AMP synthase [Treponema sp.]|nr:threonylcarbamoyl-AMP synthase [Treponema sp.]